MRTTLERTASWPNGPEGGDRIVLHGQRVTGAGLCEGSASRQGTEREGAVSGEDSLQREEGLAGFGSAPRRAGGLRDGVVRCCLGRVDMEEPRKEGGAGRD